MVRRLSSRLRTLPRWWRVRSAWARGQRMPALPVEPADQALIAEGRALRATSISAARDRHAGLGLRVFLVRPPTISGQVWFDGLATALRHTGVPAEVVGDDDRDWPDRWRALQPTALVAPDRPAVHARLGADARADLVARGGVRLLVPMAPSGFPASDSRNEDEEAAVRAALAGETADAFVSLYEPEFFASYCARLADAGFRYLALPQACDPFQDAPRDVPRRHAWFMVSAFTPDRVTVADDCLRPVLGSAPGLWVGSGWHFGSGRVPPSSLPELFSSSRVALAPLVRFLREQPLEITYRVFAAAASGAFQVTHRTPVTDRFFSTDELVQANDDREFAALVTHYLPRRDERLGVARRALARVYRVHTTFERADRLVAFLRSRPSRPTP